jgi:DNA-binding MarR family transcriptional regulator
MTQTAFWPEDPTAAFHKSNPESAAAFERIVTHLSRLQGAVLTHVYGRAGGSTVKEVRRDLHMEHQTASARLTELSGQGFIVRRGDRRDHCAVWKITTEGAFALLEWGKSTTSTS